MAETADFIYVEPAMKCELGLNRNLCSTSHLRLSHCLSGGYDRLNYLFPDQHCPPLYEMPKPALAQNRYCLCE
jgi:hypothetical protein